MYTELLYLNAEGLKDVLDSYPEFREDLSANLVLTFDLASKNKVRLAYLY